MSGPNDAIPDGLSKEQAILLLHLDRRMVAFREQSRKETHQMVSEIVEPILARLDSVDRRSEERYGGLAHDVRDVLNKLALHGQEQQALENRIGEIEDDKKAAVRWAIGAFVASIATGATAAWKSISGGGT